MTPADYDRLLTVIRALLDRQARVIAAIDGRCGAGKSTMHTAYRVHFCLFETDKGEIPCICARKVLCCLYIAVFCGVRREKKLSLIHI